MSDLTLIPPIAGLIGFVVAIVIFFIVKGYDEGGDALKKIADQIHTALATDSTWPRGQKTRFRKPFEALFTELQFLNSLLSTAPSTTTSPLPEDWHRHCHHGR